MIKDESVRVKARSASDAAIDGLIAGMFAGIVMILVIILGGLTVRLPPLMVLTSFGAGQATTPAGGALVHLSVSGIYGAFFGLLAYWLPQHLYKRLPGWLAGLVYAAGLLLMALGFILPGFTSPLANLPVWLLALGHGAYGLVLGWRVLH